MAVRGATEPVFVVVDRLSAGSSTASRVCESLEIAMARGLGRCVVFVPASTAHLEALWGTNDNHRTCPIRQLDGQAWMQIGFSQELACEDCQLSYPRLEPRLFSFNSPLGACPHCEGFGNTLDIDMELVVPNANKSLSEGAIAPWNTPAYAHELQELLALAGDYDLPIHQPYRELSESHRRLIREGVPERDFGGLDGFFRWLERRKYKMPIRVFLSRWRSHRICPSCQGARLRPEALAVRIAGHSIAELSRLEVRYAIEAVAGLELSDHDRSIAAMLLEQVQSRLGFLRLVGLDYLTVDRTLKTLSAGEAQRVALTSALGSSLVNMLYVLDEPSVGLHPNDVRQLQQAILQLKTRGNTVVLVEHEESLIQAADQVIEIGPAAGEEGGRVTFQGSPRELLEEGASLTGDYLTGRRGLVLPEHRRAPEHGWVRIQAREETICKI